MNDLSGNIDLGLVEDFELMTYNTYRVENFSKLNIVCDRVEVSSSLVPFFRTHKHWASVIDWACTEREIKAGVLGRILGPTLHENPSLNAKSDTGENIGVIKLISQQHKRTVTMAAIIP